jgi:hypothetical protein
MYSYFILSHLRVCGAERSRVGGLGVRGYGHKRSFFAVWISSFFCLHIRVCF